MKDKRQTYLKAGRRQLRQVGVNDFSLRQVAQAVGQTPMAVYRHFRDRNDLLAAMAAQGFEELLRGLTSVHEADFLLRLTVAADRIVNYATQHPDLALLMFGGELDSQPEHLQKQRRACRRSLERMLNKAQDAQEIREFDVRVMTDGFWYLVTGFILGLLNEPEKSHDPREEIAALVSLWVVGVGA